jgi:four helix bundle protein
MHYLHQLKLFVFYGMQLSHKNLIVYNESVRLVTIIYRLTSLLPNEEKFGLTSQLRRASVSVCSNIAEGAARRSSQERRRFYEIARSSCVEVDAQLELTVSLTFLNDEQIIEADNCLTGIFKMLSKMITNT